MIEHLARATQAVDTGDLEAALAALLDAWRACRHERIADLIDRVSARIERPGPGGKKSDDKQQRWLAMAARDPADVGAVLAALTEIRKAEPLQERIAKLARGPADPRIAAALVKLVIEQLPIPGGTGIAPVRLALATVAALGDRRQIAELERMIALKTPVGKARDYVTTDGPRFIAELTAKPTPTLDAAALALVADLDACLAETAAPARGDAEALFAAVYAHPEDDEPRAILADHLQESGDPRGEFIALQLARARGGARTKREGELLRAHGRAWLGAIEPMVQMSNVVFERGFLARCGVKADSLVEDPLATRPEWATVTDVDIGNIRARDDEAFLARMPALRAIRGVWGVPAARPLLEELEIDRLDASRLPELTLERFPALRRLAIANAWATVDELAPLWVSPLGRQLTAVSVAFSRYDHGDAMRLLDLAVENVTTVAGPWTFKRAGAVLTVKPLRAPSPAWFDVLAATLARVTTPRVREIVVESGGVPPPPGIVEMVAARVAIHE